MAMKGNKKGFALIFVMVFIAMIMGIVGDVVYQSQITAKNTYIEEDEIYAQMAARTGVEFAKFMLVLTKLASNYANNPAVPIPPNLYNMLNGQPIGAESFKDLQNLSGIDFLSVISPEILKALKAMKGYFVLNITAENTKFNLNLLQSTYSSSASKALLRLFSAPDTEKFLQIYGYNSQQITDNLTAYIKISITDGVLESKVLGDYSTLGLKYLPKHAVLETLEELRRIPGFEVDEIYNMFTPYFTIWPLDGKQNSLNINSAPIELISAFMTPQSKEPDDAAWDKFENYKSKNTFAQNTIGSWFQSNLKSFVEDKDADEIRKNIFGVNDTIFRIESRGVMNNLEKKLLLIVQQNVSSSSLTSVSGTGTSSPSASSSENTAATQNSSANDDSMNILYSQWVD